jgi:4-phytase/acid phosphatase
VRSCFLLNVAFEERSNLSWLIGGRLNDTPPGGALVFELWQKRGAANQEVRVFYTAQTLEQMRNATPLDLVNPPERVAVFVPGCSQADASCEWNAFQRSVRAADTLDGTP